MTRVSFHLNRFRLRYEREHAKKITNLGFDCCLGRDRKEGKERKEKEKEKEERLPQDQEFACGRINLPTRPRVGSDLESDAQDECRARSRGMLAEGPNAAAYVV